MIIEFITLILLCLGTISDIRSYYVSPKITIPIWILSAIIINFDNTINLFGTIIVAHQFLKIKIILSILLLIAYYLTIKGYAKFLLSADLVIIPLMFTMNLVSFTAFFTGLWFSSIVVFVVCKLKKIDMPGYVPIWIGYICSLVI